MNEYSNYSTYGLEREFQYIEEYVENIRSGIADVFFINFFAPEGFAKTELLDKTWQEYERTIPIAKVTVKDYLQLGGVDLRAMILQIIRDFEERLPRRTVNLPAGYKQTVNENRLMEILLGMVNGAKDAEKIFLLLFDDYDLLPGQFARRLEERLFAPLVQSRRVGVILTSKLELVFNDVFDLRMRLDRYEVSSLSIEDISRSFPKLQAIAPEIYILTGGMKGLIVGLINQFERFNITSSNFSKFQMELMHAYYKEQIEDKILEHYDEKSRETFLVLSLLRRFDIRILKEILPDVLPQYYNEENFSDYYIELIKSLGNSVQWRSQGGYTIVPALRVALQGYVRFCRPEDLFKRGNEAAVRLYRKQLNESYKEYYLIELIYHEIILHRFEKGLGLFPIQEKIGRELVEYLNGESAQLVREEDLDLLRNWLKSDPDISIYINDEALKAIDLQIRVLIIEAQVLTEKGKAKEKK